MAGRSSRRWLTLRRFDEGIRSRRDLTLLCGVDEVGRGPLAGPVVAAAVVLPARVRLPGLDDSKVLEPIMRSDLALRIRRLADAVSWSFVGPRRIDRINILRASLLAMRRSLQRLAPRLTPDYILVDGNIAVPGISWQQETVIGGDGKSLAIAAASVVAKCLRDAFMARLDREFPLYGFGRNKGYATRDHLEALDKHGPCPWHRFTYAPVRQSELFSSGSAQSTEPAPVASQWPTR